MGSMADQIGSSANRLIGSLILAIFLQKLTDAAMFPSTAESNFSAGAAAEYHLYNER